MRLSMSVKEKLLLWARTKSPWVMHINSGSCNGCDIEILCAFTPLFDVERFGILLKGSSRHADVLLITGTMTLQARDRVKRVYEQMTNPKFVIAVGTCTTSGCVFYNSYSHMNGVEADIPVDVYISGCPPKPEAIIHAVTKLLGKVREHNIINEEKSAIDNLLLEKIAKRRHLIEEEQKASQSQ